MMISLFFSIPFPYHRSFIINLNEMHKTSFIYYLLWRFWYGRERQICRSSSKYSFQLVVDVIRTTDFELLTDLYGEMAISLKCFSFINPFTCQHFQFFLEFFVLPLLDIGHIGQQTNEIYDDRKTQLEAKHNVDGYIQRNRKTAFIIESTKKENFRSF